MNRLIALVILLAVGPAYADETPTLAERAAAIDHASNEPDGARVVLGHLSRTLGLSAETLRTEQTTTGLDWGDLLIAHCVARQGSLRLEDLVTERRSGRAWEDIARDHAIDLARLTDDVRHSQEAIEQRAEDKSPHGTDTGADKRRGGGARSGKGSRTPRP